MDKLTVIPIDNKFFTCIVERDLSHGHYYCGYIGIRRCFAIRYDLDIDGDKVDSKIYMHGGCTYGPTLEPPTADNFDLTEIPGLIVWVGYDCAHTADLPKYGGTFKDQAWQVDHLKSIVKQLNQLKDGVNQ